MQQRAQEIADLLHDIEGRHRKTGRAIAKLHKMLEKAACDLGGIDVAPLSAGGDKPVNPER